VFQLAAEIEYDRAGRVLSGIGAIVAFAAALAGALGSQRTTDWQNLGLLILSAFLVAAI